MSDVLVEYRLHDSQDTSKNPLAISEGDTLWINMMEKVTLDSKIKLEGSEYGFYREMEKFLKNTSYKKATQFSLDMTDEIIQKNKDGKLAVSIVSHSANKHGAERAMLDLIDVLLKNNIFVHVILPGDGPLRQELINRNIIYDEVNIRWWANVDSPDNIEEEINGSALEIALVLNKIKPDIVYTVSSVVSVGAIAAKILGIPHIWNIAEFGREEHNIKYLLPENERMQFIADYSAKIFFVSEAIKKCYTDKVDIFDKSSVFAPIVDNNADESAKNSEIEYYKKDAFKIAILGNIAQGKGQKDAVLAVCEILKKKKDIELIIAGSISDEKYYDELEKIVADRGAQDNIKFIGYIDNGAQLIKQSDIVLVCAVFEGFGRVTIEAMLQNKPVVGANSGATPELIENGKNGFLYESGDFKKLAEKIEFFIDNKSKIIEFGENGQNFAKEKFDENMYSEKLLDELNELKGRKRGVSPESLDMLLDAVVKKNKKIQELEWKNNELKKEKEMEVVELKDEINLIKLSKFWKLRNWYLKLKFVIFSPVKCFKKYFLV
ncbi:MAG: glycosyltransferase family 4 protein [Candidatus Moraniibacteriota bacterium]